MSKQQEAMRLALEALERLYNDTEIMVTQDQHRAMKGAITALRAALAEPVQEPVASIYITPEGEREFDDWRCDLPVGRTELYAAPPQRKPEPNSDYERGFVDGMSEQARRSVDKAVNAMTKCKPLAEEEIARLVTNDMVKFARAVERAHGITS